VALATGGWYKTILSPCRASGFSGYSWPLSPVNPVVSFKNFKKSIDTIFALLLQTMLLAVLPAPKFYPHQP
jgi:hypothetical protein